MFNLIVVSQCYCHLLFLFVPITFDNDFVLTFQLSGIRTPLFGTRTPNAHNRARFILDGIVADAYVCKALASFSTLERVFYTFNGLWAHFVIIIFRQQQPRCCYWYPHTKDVVIGKICSNDFSYVSMFLLLWVCFHCFAAAFIALFSGLNRNWECETNFYEVNKTGLYLYTYYIYKYVHSIWCVFIHIYMRIPYEGVEKKRATNKQLGSRKVINLQFKAYPSNPLAAIIELQWWQVNKGHLKLLKRA